MDSSKKYISARIPNILYLSLKKRAEERKVSFTEIVIEAFEQYIGGEIVGLCPKCHTQNPPDARYCSECSNPLVPDAYAVSFNVPVVTQIETETITSLQNQIDELRSMIHSNINDAAVKAANEELRRKRDEEQSKE